MGLQKRSRLITCIQNKKGVFVKQPLLVAEVLESHLKEIWTKEQEGTMDDQLAGIKHIPQTSQANVNQQQNELLIQPFSMEELRKAVFEQPKERTTGEFGAEFYQVNWNVI